jgi:hypothetical protein
MLLLRWQHLCTDVMGEYVVQLVVTNNQGTMSLPATVTISTTNTRPIADAGPYQSVTVGDTTIVLDGSMSWGR